ncbi:hypothetical protein Lal_00025962 [Lupinus albus]|uniref:Uncharacterized protein n=1 Tax=Lupinus albus TaxID=3870 RepID=A0A6A5LGQ9_LUPAL|nr:hypothetical protein Lalb_Chr09g0324461 [Lupinus albus]KAF1861584.1 hypothetical protein Lal_00025962 [Lupinus albus]
MATFSFNIVTTSICAAAGFSYRSKTNWRRYKPSTRISCVGWDPEGLFGRPQGGHIDSLEFRKRLEKDSDAREAFDRQIREEAERRQAVRDFRVPPDTPKELIEYFLDTEAQDIEYEIARMRPRLTKEFYAQLKSELGQIRFAVTKTQEMEGRLIELEALEKALEEGKEAFDKMQDELVKAKESLHKIFTAKDVKVTLLEMVERNEINRSLLALLDENIANARRTNQMRAAGYMEKLRGDILKYITV